ncbi:MAG: DUF4080 domain-containing protein [Planctomycetaceae bacterium]
MTSIVLTTLNARYIHASFGLRYLQANLGALQADSVIREFTINDNLQDVLAAILSEAPQVVGFGVYIWNVDQTLRLIADLRQVAPDVIIVLGGPEVSYETETQPIVTLADYVITGEADLEFRLLCERLLSTATRPPRSSYPQILHAPVPQLDQLQLPYELYSGEDLAHRVLYVEASRGCPFTCEFCLSALEIPVRAFSLPLFLESMQRLLERGAKQFKFVDRTFNLNLRISRAIMEFFLERWTSGLFLHFELIPDRLPESLREIIQRFPAGSLQFEIGVQTFSDEVSQLISRPQDNSKLEENLRFLRSQTGVHIHTDLIVGLPGESLESFAAGFDRLYELHPQEIQVGILKRLRGTPIIRHDSEWQMVYSRNAPYEILSNRLLSFEKMNGLRRFARYWDLVGNSGNFAATLRMMLDESASAFAEFQNFCDWLYEKEQRRHGISLSRLFERVFEYLTDVRGLDERSVALEIWSDYTRSGRRDRPAFLRKFELPPLVARQTAETGLPERQLRHL